MTATFEADTDLDGRFDEKDREARYDQFNYGVLTTRYVFSCGNLMPVVIQEGGAVLIGETTGGGPCCIQTCSLSDGLGFLLSGSQWQLTDCKGADVEDGCRIDLAIEPGMQKTKAPGSGAVIEISDCSVFFDGAELDRMMNEWFAEEALAPAA